MPKSWPPSDWKVPPEELAFLKEGEDQRDYFAKAAQQAVEKLGEGGQDQPTSLLKTLFSILGRRVSRS